VITANFNCGTGLKWVNDEAQDSTIAYG